MSTHSKIDRNVDGTYRAIGTQRVAIFILTIFFGFLAGCATTQFPYDKGVAAKSFDPTVRGPVSGVGIEAQDIISMTDEMMRDMLTSPALSARTKPPRVIIDDAAFRNESSQPINKKLIVNKLRVNLARAAEGRMRFVGREFADVVQKERTLKREGITDVGTTGLTKAQAGVDYRLTGTIATLDSSSRKSGLEQRYTQITFEMIDLESGELVWGNTYEISRAAADDVLYR